METGLTPQQQQQIEGNYVAILNWVEADKIMDKFVDEGFFSIRDVVEDIMKQTSEKGKTKRLLSLLRQRTSEESRRTIFDFFLSQLTENGYKDLAQKIRTTEKRPIQVSEGNDHGEPYTSGFPDVSEKVKNAIVTETDAMFLSKTIRADKVEEFGKSLGFGGVDVSHIQHDSGKFGTLTVVQHIIVGWQHINGRKGTLGNLLEQMKINACKIAFDMDALKRALQKIESSRQ